MGLEPGADTRSMRERMLAGDLYRGADAELEAEMAQAMRLTKRLNDGDPGDVAAITIGDDVMMGPNVQLLTPTHPLDPDTRRDKWEAALPITIGNNVWVGGMVVICPRGDDRRRRRGRRKRRGHQGRALGYGRRRQPRPRRPLCPRTVVTT